MCILLSVGVGGKVTNHGVCSTWLNELEVGAEVPAFVRT